MANITEPEDIGFCDTDIRPVARLICQVRYFAETIQSKWNNKFTTHFSPASDSDMVEDSAFNGSGRQVISTQDVANVVTAVNALVTAIPQSTLDNLLQVVPNPIRD